MKCQDRSWDIYMLSDPSSGAVRYIGATTVGGRSRLSRHLRNAKAGVTYRDKWIRLLRSRGDVPVLSVIESGFGYGWQSRERYWIAHMRNSGVRLTNLTDGGDGTTGYVFTPDVRAKMSAALKGNTNCLGKSIPFEVRVKLSMATLGKPKGPFSIKHRANMSAAHKGKKLSVVTRARISASQIGRSPSDETREKLSASKMGNTYNLGRRHSRDTLLRMSLAKIGHKHSEATRQKLREARAVFLNRRNELEALKEVGKA